MSYNVIKAYIFRNGGLRMDYLEWNRIISRHFFNEEMAGREVILYVDSSLLNKLGESYGVGVEDFIEAVVDGPSQAYEKGFCNKALWALGRSRISGSYRQGYPLYIAYLAFLVLAVDTDGDFSDHAFYPRLNTLLGKYGGKVQPGPFMELDELWLDLQVWSIEIKSEKLGRFTTKPVGSWRHVGLPISQTLITSEEREKLPIFFAQNDFDPMLLPDCDTLSKAVSESPFFKNRTKKLILSGDNEYKHLKVGLLELIQTALVEWDGVASDIEDSDIQQNGWINSMLRLCINLDNFASSIKVSARFKTNCEFPDDEFDFFRHKDSSLWKSKGSIRNWSTELVGYYSKNTKDATLLCWSEEEVFIDNQLRWRVKLKPSLVRIFISGKHEGLNGWVETNRIEPGIDCLIAFHESKIEGIVNWGMNSCDGFSNLDYEGIPPQWKLYMVKNIRKPHPEIDILKFPLSYSIRFEGGIKSGKGNSYFRLAPPRICIEGITGNETVKVSGREITDHLDNIWLLPEDVEVNSPLKIELFDGNTCVMSRILILEEGGVNFRYNPPTRDKYGEITTTRQQFFSVSGANVQGVNLKDIPMYKEHPPTYMSHRIIFIGNHPGLYCEWPDDNLPDNWDAVWAIAKVKRDRWKVYFVGKDLSQCTLSVINKSSTHWKKWKKVLVNLNIEPPKIRKLYDLWKMYKKGAQKL